MALPPPSERNRPPKKGKSKARRYLMVWCYREEDSNNMDEMNTEEVRSTNVNSAQTALLKALNEGEEDKLKKSDIVVVDARVMGRGE